jgi:hypothetical protein
MNREPNNHIAAAGQEPPAEDFAANEIRLSWRQWLVALAMAGGVLAAAPRLWESVEPRPAGADSRVPYELSEDYWLFERHCRSACEAGRTLVVGDSVMWGHYVSADRTLSAALNRLAGAERFANLGTDGIHPAALAGLIEHHGAAMTGRNVILHCNLLWMSSPRHDLTTVKHFTFNHAKLVPQLSPWIRCYDADVSERVSTAVRRRAPALVWAEHLRLAYYDGNDVPRWTVDHPHDRPIHQLGKELPDGRAAASPPADAVAWTARRPRIRKYGPQWVELASSFQWAQFRRAVQTLRDRGNRLFVLVGPFNEHMLEDDSLAAYRQRRDAVAAWLREGGIAHWAPGALPSALYADASHPLAEGYAELARRLYERKDFAGFDGRAGGRAGAVGGRQ